MTETSVWGSKFHYYLLHTVYLFEHSYKCIAVPINIMPYRKILVSNRVNNDYFFKGKYIIGMLHVFLKTLIHNLIS